jgi:3-methyl-2-oxobutanoate hydroxymethyltransferase
MSSPIYGGGAADAQRSARLTPEAIRARKGGEPVVCLTAYTAPRTRIMDPHVDLILIGDSVAMTLYGMKSTVGISLDAMILHGRAVAGAASHACVVLDLPAGTYEDSPEQAVASARRAMEEAGVDAVKLEGGAEMAPQIRAIVDAGIPVMAHVGLLPQSVEKLGGYKVQGKSDEGAARLVEDAKAVEAAGAFCVVVEATIEAVAVEITKAVGIPTIGIGASADCDGQILVSDDMLGLHGNSVPKFVKLYADLEGVIGEAVAAYAKEVRARAFPTSAQTYARKPEAKH